MSSATEPDQFSQKTALIRLRSHSRRSENVVHGCRLPNGSYLQNNIARSAPLIGLGLHRVGFDRAIRRMSRPSPLQVANVLAKKPISGRRHGTRGRQIVPRRGRIRDPLRRRTAITHAARPFRSGRTEAASRQCPGSHRPPRGFVGPLRPTAPVARSVAPPTSSPARWSLAPGTRPCHDRLRRLRARPARVVDRRSCRTPSPHAGALAATSAGSARDRAGAVVGRASRHPSL